MKAAAGSSLELQGVSKRFGDQLALRDVSIAIEAGERIGLIGPSGAGKTTLLKLLGGMLQPSEGQIRVAGDLRTQLSPRELRRLRRATGFIHQNLDLVPELRVLHNVMAGGLGDLGFFGALRMMVRPKRKDLLRAHACLEQVALAERMYERTSKLSGGQAQRVAIARMLYQDPSAILADEPVSAVDPARARDLLEILERINEETGKTVVVSLHALDLARQHCRRLVGMRAGAIVFDRPVAEVDEADLEELYELEESS